MARKSKRATPPVCAKTPCLHRLPQPSAAPPRTPPRTTLPPHPCRRPSPRPSPNPYTSLPPVPQSPPHTRTTRSHPASCPTHPPIRLRGLLPCDSKSPPAPPRGKRHVAVSVMSRPRWGGDAIFSLTYKNIAAGCLLLVVARGVSFIIPRELREPRADFYSRQPTPFSARRDNV